MKRLFAAIVLLCIMLLPEAAYPGENDIVIQRGTEILVKIMDRLKSNNAQVGQNIRFLVERGARNDDGFVLIPDGAIAYGKVTKVAKAGYFGAGGKLGITIDSVEAYNGTPVQLSGIQENEGENVTALGAGIFRGTNAVIEAGTVFAAYVTHTTVLEERPDGADMPAQQTPPARQAAPVKQPAPVQRAVPVKVVKQAAPARPAAPVQQAVAPAKPASQVQQAAAPAKPSPQVQQQTAPAEPSPQVQQAAAPAKQAANQDKDYDFLLVNKSGTTFSSIYIALGGKPYWHLEQDKIKGGMLRNGDSREINLPRQKGASHLSQRKSRFCHLLIKLPNGQEWKWTNVDFEDVYKIEISKKDGKPHMTRFVP